MFGFGKRKKFNGIIDTKLNNEYQIETRGNEKFPGLTAYLELIDNAWNGDMSEDEGALYIAVLYYCGLLKAGHTQEAESLLSRIHSIADFGVRRQMISQARWDKFHGAIVKTQMDLGLTV